MPGAGAAGGAGAGAVAFLKAKLLPGAGIVLKSVKFEEKIRGCRLVITGEGKIDEQTLYGKTVSAVAGAARKNKIPVLAFCGQTGKGFQKVRRLGIAQIHALMTPGISYEQALRRAGPLLKDAVQKALQKFRLPN